MANFVLYLNISPPLVSRVWANKFGVPYWPDRSAANVWRRPTVYISPGAADVRLRGAEILNFFLFFKNYIIVARQPGSTDTSRLHSMLARFGSASET